MRAYQTQDDWGWQVSGKCFCSYSCMRAWERDRDQGKEIIRHNRTYTQEEDAMIEEWYLNGVDFREIGRRLNRSRCAVSTRYYKVIQPRRERGMG